MSKNEILRMVNEIFCEVFDDDELLITFETTAEDIEDWDSLEQINLIMLIEERFSIKFRMDEITELKNVGAMIDLVEKKLNQ